MVLICYSVLIKFYPNASFLKLNVLRYIQDLVFAFKFSSDYATESCGHVHGPDQLTVLEFDKNVDHNYNRPSDGQNLLPPVELR